MTDIYADMAMADALLSQNYQNRRVADTSRVYAAILQNYGYTEEDFRTSEEAYIKDAGRYVRMVKKAVLKLDAEKKALKEEKRRIDDMKDRAAAVRRFAPHRIYLLDTLGIADSVLFGFDFQEGLDTAFRGPLMIVWADTAVLAQMRKDSLAAETGPSADAVPESERSVAGRQRTVNETVKTRITGRKADAEVR